MEETSSEEQTFKQYTPAQAKAYAAIRGGYHDRLFNVILDHHKSTGGSFHALLDVGCGPGNATRPLAKHFEVAYGLDPSPEMINVASEIGKETGAAETLVEDESNTYWEGRRTYHGCEIVVVR